MKHANLFVPILIGLLMCVCCAFSASAAEFTVDFTRDEAYEEIMNTTPEQAKRLYGGQVSYYAALTDGDKDALFDMIWNCVASGLLSETNHDDEIELSDFTYEYYLSILSAFRQTHSDEEGLTNLRNNIAEINAEYFSEGVQSSVEIVPQTDLTESVISETTTVAAQTVPIADETESITTTTTAIMSEQSDSHIGLIVFVSFLVIAGSAVIGYLIYRKKTN